MTLWFLRGLRRRVVTTRYPGAAESSVGSLPSPPAFVPALLTEQVVDELVAVCPSRALWRDGADLVYDVGACTWCGRCYQVARGAARPSRIVELAASARGHLVKRIPVRTEDNDVRHP